MNRKVTLELSKFLHTYLIEVAVEEIDFWKYWDKMSEKLRAQRQKEWEQLLQDLEDNL